MSKTANTSGIYSDSGSQLSNGSSLGRPGSGRISAANTSTRQRPRSPLAGGNEKNNGKSAALLVKTDNSEFKLPGVKFDSKNDKVFELMNNTNNRNAQKDPATEGFDYNYYGAPDGSGSILAPDPADLGDEDNRNGGNRILTPKDPATPNYYDHLPESPHFPSSLYRVRSPIKGASNVMSFRKHGDYMLNSRGFVVIRAGKILSYSKEKQARESAGKSPARLNSAHRKSNESSSSRESSAGPTSPSSAGPRKKSPQLIELQKRKSRIAYRTSFIKELQDVQRKLSVLEERANQLEEANNVEANGGTPEMDEITRATATLQLNEDILEAIVNIKQRVESIERSKLEKQSMEGIVRPIMNLIKFSQKDFGILKEGAKLFKSLANINEEVHPGSARGRKSTNANGSMASIAAAARSGTRGSQTFIKSQHSLAPTPPVISTPPSPLSNPSPATRGSMMQIKRSNTAIGTVGRTSNVGSASNMAQPIVILPHSGSIRGSGANGSSSNHNSANRLASNSHVDYSLARLAHTKSDNSDANLVNNIFQTNNNAFGDLFFVEDNLLSGMLKNYLEANFMDRLELMDKVERVETIKNLLLLFRKVGKLLSAANFISVELNMNNALEKVITESCSIVDAERCLMWFVDKNTKELRPLNLVNPATSPKPFSAIPKGVGIAGQVVHTREPLVVDNAMKSPHYDERVDSCPDIKTKTVLCVPILNKEGNVEAIIELINKKRSLGDSLTNTQTSFSEEDVFLLKNLAIHSSIVIENARSYETIRKTQKKVEVLLGTTRSLSSELELEKLIQAIMQAARELLSADRCTLFLLDHEKGELWSQVQGRNGLETIRFGVGIGIAGYVATTGNNVNIADAYKDPRFNPEIDKKTGYRTQSILCMAIKNISGQIIGVTQMINKLNGEFVAEDEQLLAAFSAQAAVAIEKSYLFKKTEEMRNLFENILRSITNSVLTISDQGFMTSLNHAWFLNALGKTEEELRGSSYNNWLRENNITFADDIDLVFKTQEVAQCTEYELKSSGGSASTFVNYSVMPLVGSSTSGVVVVLEDLSREKRIMNTLGRYMAPELAKQVLANGGAVIGGTRQKVTTLFTDIRSFTKISESMPPAQVVALLNRHFEDAVNAIQAEQGVLDKYIGDSVMAVFGIPFVRPEDAIHACNTALRIIRAVEVLNGERVPLGLQPLRIGIGINTGEALSGNIGSEKRMEYTVVGDSVNLASRVEGLTKYYGVDILITSSTRRDILRFKNAGRHNNQQHSPLSENGTSMLNSSSEISILTNSSVGNLTLEHNNSNSALNESLHASQNCPFILREIDSVVVVGKSKVITIYQLLGHAAHANSSHDASLPSSPISPGNATNQSHSLLRASVSLAHTNGLLNGQGSAAASYPPLVLDPARKKCYNFYESGLLEYRRRNFVKAREFFEKANEAFKDPPSQLFAARCEEYMANPPPPDWDGAYTFTSK